MGLFDFFRARKQAPQLEAVFVSEIGLRRPDNQDNVLTMVNHGVFAVADGIGGGSDGAMASAMVCSELKSMVRVGGEDFEARLTAAQVAIASANSAIRSWARERGYEKMGTTVAAMVFDVGDASRAATIHVGDSRVYRFRGGMAERLTRDHHEFGGTALTRAVGATPRISCEVAEIEVSRGDRFLLCTDGVHGALADQRIASLVCGGTVEDAATRLSDGVIRAGAPDNYSFVIIDS